MWSTPFTFDSIGTATLSSTTSALAPGKTAETSTTGGVIGGNWATGRVKSAIPPARVITIEITKAKRGLSMKKRLNIFSGSRR